MNESDNTRPIDTHLAHPNESAPARTTKGQFSPGRSGNPAGRPRAESTALRVKLAERAEDVVEAVIAAATAGDMAAAKMILDRVIPSLRPHSAPVEISLNGSLKPAQAAGAILD